MVAHVALGGIAERLEIPREIAAVAERFVDEAAADLAFEHVGFECGEVPACAKACPTESIQFAPLTGLHHRADQRLAQLHAGGIADARLYGRDPDDGVGGTGAFLLLLDEPEVYGLPPDPVVATRDLP